MRKKIFLAAAVCWMAVIFAFSSRDARLSTQDSTSIGKLVGKIFVPDFLEWDQERQQAFAQKVDHPVRKTAHAAEYAVLGLFAAGSYSDRKKKLRNSICIPWLAGSVYAASDELHQMFVPGRSCQLPDVLLDSFGVIAGVLIGQLLWRKIFH